MIIIDNQVRGRHGNKVFHFNTLCQLSAITGQIKYTVNWDGYDRFQDTCKIISVSHNTDEIPFSDLIFNDHDELVAKYASGNWRLHPLSLTGPFFRISKMDPRQFITLKQQPALPKCSVGIHIRGGDTRGADGKHGMEIHLPEYYINAIDFVLNKYNNPQFYLCTDDPDHGFPSYSKTLKYLKDKNVNLHHKINNNYINDFAILSECDVLISGSSTFALAAGMIGKHKKIIHSKDFVEQFKDEDQKWYSNFGNGMFFHDLNHMTSQFYGLWQLL